MADWIARLPLGDALLLVVGGWVCLVVFVGAAAIGSWLGLDTWGDD